MDSVSSFMVRVGWLALGHTVISDKNLSVNLSKLALVTTGLLKNSWVHLKPCQAIRPRQKSCQVHLRRFLAENFSGSILRPVWSPITQEPYLLVNGSLPALALIYIRAVRDKVNIK